MNGCACCPACQPAPGRPRGRRGRWTRGAVAPTYRANAADRAAVKQPKAPQPRPSICRPTRIGGSSDLPRGSSFAEQNAAIALRRALVCSTPFGITEYIGRWSAVRRPASHREGAQRLSASRSISASDRPIAVTVSTSAQRLSASRSISGAGCGAPLSSRFRCSTPFGITEYIGSTSDSVMRRCSAQRLSASRSISGTIRALVEGEFVECSTPFGITEYIGVSLRRGRRYGRCPSAQRLSASRSISDLWNRLKVIVSEECSTPFGITEYIGTAVDRRR